MENRIKNWLENLDIHAIKNTDEMKMIYPPPKGGFAAKRKENSK
jgi:hypothetical protein